MFSESLSRGSRELDCLLNSHRPESGFWGPSVLILTVGSTDDCSMLALVLTGAAETLLTLRGDFCDSVNL